MRTHPWLPLALLLVAAPARAQDGAGEVQEDVVALGEVTVEAEAAPRPRPRRAPASAPAPEATEPAATPDADEEPAPAGDRPRLLLVTRPVVPGTIRRALPGLVDDVGTLASTRRYELAARARNLEPASTHALRRIATRRGADVIVVAGFYARGRTKVVRMSYLHGRTGRELLRVNHTLRRSVLSPAAQHGILRELRMVASRVRTGIREADAPPPAAEGEGGDDLPAPDADAAAGADADAGDVDGAPPTEDADSGEEEARRPFELHAAAGFGFGARAAALPTEAGPVRLTTTLYPAVHVGLEIGVNPSPTGWFGIGARIDYSSSAGLRTEDVRSDGTRQTVGTRTQFFAAAIDARFRLTDGAQSSTLHLGVGYEFRLFQSEAPMSMPEYTLGGPFVRAGLTFPIGNGPLSLGVVPEVARLRVSGGDARDIGAVDAGFAFGAEASARLRLLDQLSLEVLYRESHAFIDSDLAGRMKDTERFAMLRAIYTP